MVNFTDSEEVVGKEDNKNDNNNISSASQGLLK